MSGGVLSCHHNGYKTNLELTVLYLLYLSYRLVVGSTHIPPSFCTDALPHLAVKSPKGIYGKPIINPTKSATLLLSPMDQVSALKGKHKEVFQITMKAHFVF